MEGHEGIPSASIILCLTVTSTFMLLYLIGIIKTQAMRIQPLRIFQNLMGLFLSLVQMENSTNNLLIRALFLYPI